MHHSSANSSQEPIQRFLEFSGWETTKKAASGHPRCALAPIEFYSLRRRFVSLRAQAKTLPQIVPKCLGHGSPLLISDVYLHLDTEQKLTAIESFPTITLER